MLHPRWMIPLTTSKKSYMRLNQIIKQNKSHWLKKKSVGWVNIVQDKVYSGSNFPGNLSLKHLRG